MTFTLLPNTAVGVGGLPSGTTVTALRDNAEEAAWFGHSWQDISSSRATNTSYQNTTGRQIMVSVFVTGGTILLFDYQVSPNNSTWVTISRGSSNSTIPAFFIVPSGSYYRVLASGPGSNVVFWAELR